MCQALSRDLNQLQLMAIGVLGKSGPNAPFHVEQECGTETENVTAQSKATIYSCQNCYQYKKFVKCVVHRLCFDIFITCGIGTHSR